MTELALMEGFSVPERAQWLALVEKALKGADFDRRLVARTADGLRIAPLYGRAEAPSGLSGQQPGAAPYLRGEATRRLHLKYAPDLSFQIDPTFAEAARIDAILARERAGQRRREDDDDAPL